MKLLTKKQRQYKEWLYNNHWREWVTARDGEFNRLSDMQSMWCCCGKLAIGFHEQRCRQFQNMVDLATIEKLKHLIPEKL